MLADRDERKKDFHVSQRAELIFFKLFLNIATGLTLSHLILSAVQVSCSIDWLMVTVSPSVCSSNLYIFADELFLGLGCPATRIQTYAYDFVYCVNDCGIRTKVRIVIYIHIQPSKCFVISKDTLLFQTEMHFIPRNMHHASQEIPLECSASRKSVWLTPVSTDNEIKVDPSPFIADFETTPEEIGLLSSCQSGFLL
ncbi:oocyte-secreted protein 2 [Trichechus inunguis]